MAGTSDINSDSFRALADRQPVPRKEVFFNLKKQIDEEQQPRSGPSFPSRPSKALSRSTRLGLSAAFLVVGLVTTSLRAMVQTPMLLLTAGTLLSTLLGYGVLLGAAPGRTRRLSLGGRRALLSLMIVGAFVALLLPAADFLSLGEFFSGGHLSGVLGCASHAMLTATVCTGLLLLTWRGTDPFTPGITGALLGAMGGLLATLGGGLACPSVEGIHLILGHGLMVLISTMLGALGGRKWLCP